LLLHHITLLLLLLLLLLNIILLLLLHLCSRPSIYLVPCRGNMQQLLYLAAQIWLATCRAYCHAASKARTILVVRETNDKSYGLIC
jgi:hypothetical protein